MGRASLSRLRPVGCVGSATTDEADFTSAGYDRAIETYALVDRSTRDLYGLCRWPQPIRRAACRRIWLGSRRTYRLRCLGEGRDIPSATQAMRLVARLDSSRSSPSLDRNPDDGSNAWAFAPSRTTSGKAILLRNPHLAWNAGYYEAHLQIRDSLDFYGDLRIGGPFGVIGGFNRDLGWATTNNDPLLWQVYALADDTTPPGRYWLDGEARGRIQTIVEYKRMLVWLARPEIRARRSGR
jgi:acyl-homoserine lactone acylase PvdQ